MIGGSQNKNDRMKCGQCEKEHNESDEINEDAFKTLMRAAAEPNGSEDRLV
jgi:hypothetical protein